MPPDASTPTATTTPDDGAATETEAEVDEEEVVDGYFTALSENTDAGRRAALDFSADGSPAEVHAIMMLVGAAMDDVTHEVIVDGDKYNLCLEGSDVGEDGKPIFCSDYDGFRFHNGKLAYFKMNGQYIQDRTVPGGSSDSTDAVAAQHLAAIHHVQSGRVAVTYELTNLTDSVVDVDPQSARHYTDAKSLHSTATLAAGPAALEPTQTATYVAAFDTEEVAGRLELPVGDETLTLELPASPWRPS